MARPHVSVKEDDVVLLINEALPLEQWTLAKVVNVFKGRYGHVRESKGS